MTHLNRSGALAFSDALATVLATRLGPSGGQSATSPRWVDLPRWREGAAAEVEALVAVEDLKESARALERLAAEARTRRGPAQAQTRADSGGSVRR
jgi:hypothetical protein